MLNEAKWRLVFMSKVLKNILKVLGIFLLAIVLLVGGFFGYLTVTEFNPKKEEKVNVSEEKDYSKESFEKIIDILDNLTKC